MFPTVQIAGNDHFETLRRCGGFYECPKDSKKQRLGPLVGYAGTYEGPSGKHLQFVGDIYANFAKAEPHDNVLKFFAGILIGRIDSVVDLCKVDAFVGAPIGGYSLTDALGMSATGIRMIKAEKQVIALKTEFSREKSKLVFGRHEVEKGWRCVIVEDVCNNFSTTGELVQLIRSYGGEVICIACFLNRSPVVDDEFVCQVDFTPGAERAIGIPVASVVRKVIKEYRQNDPEVADDVARGNVVWKPKIEWNRLMKAMETTAS